MSLVEKPIALLVAESSSASRIRKLHTKHAVKPHFIPKKYRIFNGILQSLNIQFGNYIERLVAEIFTFDKKYEAVLGYSGSNKRKFKISAKVNRLIDAHIDTMQVASLDERGLEAAYADLIKKIINLREDDSEGVFELQHDIDLLIQEKTGVKYYFEIKYNDDHDTGKYIDINRKFIKTYAYLIREFKISDPSQLRAYLSYFSKKKMKGNIYVPEKSSILRGDKLIEGFSSAKYSDLEEVFSEISENAETLAIFDKLYNQVVKS